MDGWTQGDGLYLKTVNCNGDNCYVLCGSEAEIEERKQKLREVPISSVGDQYTCSYRVYTAGSVVYGASYSPFRFCNERHYNYFEYF